MSIFRHVELDPQDREHLRELAQEVKGNPYVDGGEFASAIDAAGVNHELKLCDTIDVFCKDDSLVALQISGIPTGMSDRIVTPSVASSAGPKQEFTSESVLLSIAGCLGTVYNFVEEDLGHIVQNVYPIQQHADLQIKSNSVELTLHVDAGCHPLAPDYTVLLCLRGAPDETVPTTIVAMRDVIATLDLDEREVLHQRRFVIEQEVAYGTNGVEVPVAIWSVRYGEPAYRFDIPLAKGTDALTQRIVDKLASAALNGRQSVYLASGDALIIKNLRCVHGRSAFKPRFDGSDRWLQRVYVWKDIDVLHPEIIGRRGLSAKMPL